MSENLRLAVINYCTAFIGVSTRHKAGAVLVPDIAAVACAEVVAHTVVAVELDIALLDIAVAEVPHIAVVGTYRGMDLAALGGFA